ncbi:MAG: hypothetical protein JXB62_12475 [Pirellulales bacterium]|nr:hypothetical protein [Pirellulales bacterium]
MSSQTRRLLAIGLLAVVSWSGSAAQARQPNRTPEAFPIEQLPPGYVRGDVVSYSYVPNRYWGRAEAIGKLPYLFEYGLMKQVDGDRLETYHGENVRRIDMASQWSTAIMLSPRFPEYRDELINLMIRCFKQRQLIVRTHQVLV